jgi:phenylalanyl-tRNA synthetase alpha chain
MDNLDSIVEAAIAEFAGVSDPNQLEQAKARYLGKSGSLTERLKTLGNTTLLGR